MSLLPRWKGVPVYPNFFNAGCSCLQHLQDAEEISLQFKCSWFPPHSCFTSLWKEHTVAQNKHPFGRQDRPIFLFFCPSVTEICRNLWLSMEQKGEVLEALPPVKGHTHTAQNHTECDKTDILTKVGPMIQFKHEEVHNCTLFISTPCRAENSATTSFQLYTLFLSQSHGLSLAHTCDRSLQFSPLAD